MSLLFSYSANNIETAQLPGGYANITGIPTVGFGDGPQGINTIHCPSGAANLVWLPNISIAGSNGLVVGAGFNVTSFGSGTQTLITIGESSAGLDALVVQVNSDGSMTCKITEGTNPITSPSGTFTFGNRHEVEILTTEFNSSGVVTVYLDGVAIPALTSIQPRNISGAILALTDGSSIHSVGCGGVLGQANATLVVVDSTYAMDTTGAYCNAPVGPAISVPMFPNGVGQESAWTPVGATPGWNCIHEVPPDGDTTYISSSTVNQEEACTLSAASGISDVYGVCVISDQRQDTPGGGRTVELGIGNGTTRSYGTAWGLGTTYVMNTTPFSSNPFTSSPWALADLSTLQIACKLAS